MPGLIRGVARTAVIAGTATAVSNRVSRRQSNRWQRDAQEAEPEPQAEEAQESAPAEESMDQKIAQLKEFAALHDSGVLTDDEFAAQKAKLLG